MLIAIQLALFLLLGFTVFTRDVMLESATGPASTALQALHPVCTRRLGCMTKANASILVSHASAWE